MGLCCLLAYIPHPTRLNIFLAAPESHNQLTELFTSAGLLWPVARGRVSGGITLLRRKPHFVDLANDAPLLNVNWATASAFLAEELF